MPCSFAKDLVSTLIRSSSSSRSAWAVKIAKRVALQNSLQSFVGPTRCSQAPGIGGAKELWQNQVSFAMNNQLYVVCQRYALDVNGNAAFRRSQAGSQCLCNRGISFLGGTMPSANFDQSPSPPHSRHRTRPAPAPKSSTSASTIVSQFSAQ
jgi:hypothetical protein